jgi:superoxide dismutase, Cu-Zn family
MSINRDSRSKHALSGTALLAATALAGSALGACRPPEAPAPAAAPGFADVREAIALMRPTAGHGASGTVRFRPKPDGVELEVEIGGLPSGTRHGFHVHEFGDCSAPDAASAGGHYDPTGNMATMHQHGMKPLGDLDDLVADAQGRVRVRFLAKDLSLVDRQPILGRALLLHESFDDPNDPLTVSGDRIACGTIGVRNADAP